MGACRQIGRLHQEKTEETAITTCLPSFWPFEHARSRILRREETRCSRRPLGLAKEPVEDRVDVVAHLSEGTVAVSRGKA